MENQSTKSKLLWFAVIWCASVGVVLTLAFIIRLAIT